MSLGETLGKSVSVVVPGFLDLAVLSVELSEYIDITLFFLRECKNLLNLAVLRML